MSNTFTLEQMTSFAETFAKNFATNLVSEQAKQALKERNDSVAYKPTSIKPTKVQVKATELFKNIDKKPNEQLVLTVNDWKIKPVGIPTVIEDYYFRAELLQDITNFILTDVDYGFWMIGGHGTGKTSVAEQIAARLGMQCYSETCSERTEFLDLFGYNIPCAGGKMKFVHGGLYLAMQNGGICILNEVDAMSPSELIKLNELLGGKPVYVPQTESWLNPHKNFRLIVTSNTNGTGEDPRYIGTGQLNAAFKDRFMKTYVDYLPQEIEVEYLNGILGKYFDKSNPHYSSVREKQYKALIVMIVKVANALRKAAVSMSGGMTPPSIRATKRWLELTLKGTSTNGMSGTRSAFLKAYAYDLSEHEQNAAIEVCIEHFGSDF
ncbi:AAA domain-containing protein [Photobacterium carnosum]|uniref:AAA family ATPase n=1 Tax=Photobacterium carnosum TaxID=2023717 RepID=UPI001E558559|nr:AAA family ATPase [Photobacterium carnosum]MCD9553445.1 AAA domain-containing protein [Photobacterium carnosum]